MKRLPLLIVCLAVVVVVLFSPRAHCADTGVFVPQAAHGTPPNLNNNVGDSRTVNCFYYLPATTYQGSALNNPDYSASVMPAQCTLLDVKTGVFVCTNLQQATVSATCAATNSSGSGSVAFNWQIGNSNPVANGYFVDCAAGNDSNSGVDYLHPWLTLAKANSTISVAGSDLWIKAGTTCQPADRLNVNWSGTSNDRVVVGTYYMSGGLAFQLLPDNPTADIRDFTWSNGARAIIQGSYRSTCRLQGSGGGRCAYVGTGNGSTPGPTVPVGGYYTGLVSNDGYAYVTIQSLEIRDSAANGLTVDPFNRFGASVYRCTTNPNCQMFGILQYNKISHAASGGIYVVDAQYMIVRGNESEFSDLGDADNQPATVFGGNYFAHCDPCHIVVENNFIHDEGSEGPDCLDGSFILFRGNKMSNSGRVNLYHDGCADLVNELNVIAGGQYTREVSNAPFINMYGPAFYQMAIIKEPECTGPIVNGVCQGVSQGGVAANASQRNFYRNNVAVNMQSCMVLDLKAGQILGADGGFVGNTCIGAGGTTGDNYNVIQSGINAAGILNQNNLVAVQSGTTLCAQPNTNANLPFDHNAWTGTPSEPNCKSPGTGDAYTTFAALALPGYAHFGDADKSNFPRITDVIPSPASTAVMTLASETATYLDITKWQWEYDNFSYVPSCAPGKESSANWIKKRALDFCGATPNTAGAVNHN